MNILITGISGLLGNNLGLYFSQKAEAEVTGVYRKHSVAIPGVKTLATDLIDYPQTRKLVQDVNPDVLIHCASRTDIDAIEKDQEGGWQGNVLATKVLLDACRDKDVKFIFISTDAVYPGVQGPYSEQSPTKPCNWYGETKLEAEKLVADKKNSLILRTNIYGWNIQDKESLAEWFLNRLQNGHAVNGFSDALFSSIYTFSLAAIIDQCLQKNLSGLYNCACTDSCSKFDFGVQLAEMFGYNSKLIEHSQLDDANLIAGRGRNLNLDVSRIEKDLGQPLPSVIESLKEFYHDWKVGVPQSIKNNNEHIIHDNFYPSRQSIPYGSQVIDESDIDAVVKTLKSPYLTQGPNVQLFEESLAETVGAEYAVAVNSGTSALHIACLAAGVGPGDEVITSPNTFVASANCAIYCGAKPVFADIDPRTYNISSVEINAKITEKTKAVIPVHFAGQSCDMEAITLVVQAAEKKYGHKIFIIEDGCHALGSSYKKSPIGAGTWSDMTVFSFHPVKHITTGEGGAVVTNNTGLDKALRRFRSHGITSSPNEFVLPEQAFDDSNGKQGIIANPWYYEQQELGYNYRITDLQASLGVSQLQKLDTFKKTRRQIVNSYNEAFQHLDTIQTPYESPNCDSNFHLYVLRFDFQKLGLSRMELMNSLKVKGVQTQVHYIPVHLQPYFRDTLGTQLGDYPIVEEYYEQCLSIPLFPGLSSSDVQKVINQLTEIIEKAS